MEISISNDDRIAFAEVDYIIHQMDKFYLDKIPQKIKDYITVLKKRNIKINIDFNIPLEKQGLKEVTLYFLMILNLKYWCDDRKRKDILLILENNQKKYDKKVSNIFDKGESIVNKTEDLSFKKNINDIDILTFSNKKESIEDFNNYTNDILNNTEAIVDVKEEIFFIKLLNKIKSFFVKK